MIITEVTRFRPHPGKSNECREIAKSIKKAMLELGVANVRIYSGGVGQDAANIVINQDFLGFVDNGQLNAKFMEENMMSVWDPMFQNADLISHDQIYSID